MSTRINGKPNNPISGFQYEAWTRPNGSSVLTPLPRGNVGFNSVSGLTTETEAVSYKDGNDLYEKMLPGMTKAPEVTLSKGLDKDGSLLRWRKMIEEGTYVSQADAQFDTIIAIYDRHGTEFSNPSRADLVHAWMLPRAWPKSLSLDDLSGKSDISVLSLVLCCEGPPIILIGSTAFGSVTAAQLAL